MSEDINKSVSCPDPIPNHRESAKGRLAWKVPPLDDGGIKRQNFVTKSRGNLCPFVSN
ncbi:hypothetical protein [Novosphingobium sp. 9]|uniref:hypothetical protein n=1 Tax=Novosphingobium sp. 9 TaxID=2025349 RepID=UPI0021B6DFDA|nr:hypothetical protein [Novosphingobium sp. 9]